MGKANSQTDPKSTIISSGQVPQSGRLRPEAELLLYGDISERSWWEDAATPKRFADDLAALGDVKEITVYINSGGGDVFAAQAIGNMLERNAATVTAHIDGCAQAPPPSLPAMRTKLWQRQTAATWFIRSAWAFATT